MKISPFTKRNLNKVLFFALGWVTFGLLYSIIEKGILGGLTAYPSTGNIYDFKTSVLMNTIGALVAGILHGIIEVFYLGNRFRSRSFGFKILIKTIVYLSFITFFLLGTTFITYSYIHSLPIYSKEVFNSVFKFANSFLFLSLLIYAGSVLDIVIFFDELSDYSGHGVFKNYMFGKYHQPKEEERIFMFLDMKSSTSIAESIGHIEYFNLLNDFYRDMTSSIINQLGEIYQYVGDEVVVSWSLKDGLKNDNCLKCFFLIQDKFSEKKQSYINRYGYSPDFKAGFHMGKVTIGEIGTIKKEIIYSGDVLNTTARIQALCNEYKTSVIVSKLLFDQLNIGDKNRFKEIGDIQLRGKEEIVKLFAVKKDV